MPKGFTFSVRCHQDLTHKIGLKPIDEAYQVIGQMVTYWKILNSPFLVLETPASYVLDNTSISAARDFFDSVSLKKVRLVWEIRAQITEQVIDLMKDFNIIHCVDIQSLHLRSLANTSGSNTQPTLEVCFFMLQTLFSVTSRNLILRLNWLIV